MAPRKERLVTLDTSRGPQKCAQCGFWHSENAPESTDNIVVLLGAGASKDAGFPLADELMKDLLEEFHARADAYAENGSTEKRKAPTPLDEYRLLKQVLESCVSAKTNSKLEEVPYEILLAILRMLCGSELYELEPWWRGILAPEYTRSFDSFGSIELASHVEHRALSFLGQRMAEDPIDPDYLHHLAKLRRPKSPLKIFTLNFDIALEGALAENNIKYTNGFLGGDSLDSWCPSLLNEQAAKFDVLIHQLHGALSWPQKKLDEKYWAMRFPSDGDLDPKRRREKNMINMIAGTIRKLVPSKENRYLFDAFVNAIEEATILYVIGYRWQDLHINAPINEKLRSSDKRDFRIINVAPDTPFLPNFDHEAREEKFQFLYMSAKEALVENHLLHVLNSPEFRGKPTYTPEKLKELGRSGDELDGSAGEWDYDIPSRVC